MIRFAYPQLLWLLALIPMVALWRGRRGPRAAVGYSNSEVAREVARKSRSRFGRLAQWLRWPALALIVVAMARPQVGHARTAVSASGVDLVLAVDVSTSMEALDFEKDGERQSRIEAVKDVVARFIEARPNDRIGLVAFAGAPYLVSPATLDHDWLIRNLERLDTGMIEDGTAIGSGLAAAVNRLRDQDAKSKLVVLLTDGVNNAGQITPVLAAEAAETLGVKVHTIGVGSTGRAPITISDESGRRRTVMGEVEIDEQTLADIAETTGGHYFRATDNESLERVYAEIDQMEKTTREIKKFDRYSDRFSWAAIPALILLALNLGITQVLRRRIP